jgi:hypothetical protein
MSRHWGKGDPVPQQVRFPVLVTYYLSLASQQKPIQALSEYASSQNEKFNHCYFNWQARRSESI